jgi:cytochrome c-type biogenesis protein CcmF
MLSLIGTCFIGLGLGSAIFAAVAFGLSLNRKNDLWIKRANISLYISVALHLTALILLLGAFITNQFQLNYVAKHSSIAMPFLLKLTAIWAGQEGSLLLWSFLQILYVLLVARNAVAKNKVFINWSALILSLIAVFFSTATLFFSNPFSPSLSIPVDGLGMNPLLRHIGMIFHPPTLYIGYVGLAVPFAYALSSLIVGNIDEWLKYVRPWLLISWIFLGLGIFLGMRWAYDVLGWGGYWGWDPVENAGLMPWLMATALLHGTDRQERGKGFRLWNLVLAGLSFCLVLFGAFTTRSGMIDSVHAFTFSVLGPYFLAMIGLSLITTIFLIVKHRKEFGIISYPDKLISQDGITFFTLLLLMSITFSILIGSLLATITNGKYVASVSWFNRVVGPQLVGLVFLMGVCPLTGRILFSKNSSKWRIIPPLVGTILVPLFGYLAGFQQWISLVAFAFTGLAFGSTLGLIGFNTSARIRTKGCSLGLKSLSLVGQHSYAGHLVHLGILLMAIGVIGTQMYATEQNVSLAPGESITFENYTLTYSSLFQEEVQDHLDIWAPIFVYRNLSYVTTLQPQIVYYPIYDQLMSEPAIHASLGEDLYLVLFGWNDFGTIDMNVSRQPLSSFLWAGGLLMIIGGTFAWWPKSTSKEGQ